MAVNKRNDEMVDLLTADFLRNQFPLVMHSGAGGGGFWDGVLQVGATAITLLGASNPYNVQAILGYSAVASASNGSTGTSAGSVTPGSSAELFNDTETVVELSVGSDGSVAVERVAGDASLVIKLRLDWV